MDEQMQAYTEAVRSGTYAKKSGLSGKYDNVRKYWEDEITRQYIRPFLQKLIENKKKSLKRLRILDLGCGSADGYELLAGIRYRYPNLQEVEINLLTPDMLGKYTGIELNDELIEQGIRIYGSDPKMEFRKGDFTNGLPVRKKDAPYDLYFSSFGTSSHHNNDETLVNLLSEIAEKTEDNALIICDWLGRFSYEWQSLWTNDFKKIKNMDYAVSYIYEKDEREAKRNELQHLKLRLMSRQEAERIIKAASKKAKIPIKIHTFFDRSVFTGRHMDTADYNPHAQPIRMAVNSLHEANMRTDLNSLIINYVPKEGFSFLNRYFETLQSLWNSLVEYTLELLLDYDEEKQCFLSKHPEPPSSYPPVLIEMMTRIKRVIEDTGWFNIGSPRENIIEPQLGYALRHIVSNTQQGLGCGHGLVGILEIDKTEK
jgi:SAM-dependent methyltransferase